MTNHSAQLSNTKWMVVGFFLLSSQLHLEFNMRHPHMHSSWNITKNACNCDGTTSFYCCKSTDKSQIYIFLLYCQPNITPKRMIPKVLRQPVYTKDKTSQTSEVGLPALLFPHLKAAATVKVGNANWIRIVALGKEVESFPLSLFIWAASKIV